MGNSKRGKSLKSSLVAHQKRQTQKANEAAKHAALDAKGKAGKTGTSRKVKNAQRHKPMIPFSSTDTILLIGEGNFSFAHSLLGHPALPSFPTSNLTATAYDSESECTSKYPDAAAHISALRSAGVTVLFGVDARHLDKAFPSKSGKKWDKVVWNFPHVGQSITDQDRNIAANQSTLLGFLASVQPYLVEGIIPDPKAKAKKRVDEVSEEEGEGDDAEMVTGPKRAGSVLVTLREQEPYTLWDLPRLAKNPVLPASPRNAPPQPRYIQVRSFAFYPEAYPGYEHRRTSGWNEQETPLVGASASRQERGPCRTWEFVSRPDQV